ncbi:hypothetical protein ABZ743_32520 [Streptomyces sp. NPDC006662]|uniref:hypothetical protein n=1 Tax=Streptomyces sp. NPDC006662 TaxID=3156902 RepID=UPI0033C0C666
MPISRYTMAFASVVFISGALALPASAATAAPHQPSVVGHLSQDGGPGSDILKGGGSGGDGRNPYRDPNGGAYGPDTCLPGYVWRDSFDGDTLCVTPEERQLFHDKADPHRQPGGGVYGWNTCSQGYVWRESYKGDLLCVTPQERDAAQARRISDLWLMHRPRPDLDVTKH